jgi:hypothetical protein
MFEAIAFVQVSRHAPVRDMSPHQVWIEQLICGLLLIARDWAVRRLSYPIFPIETPKKPLDHRTNTLYPLSFDQRNPIVDRYDSNSSSARIHSSNARSTAYNCYNDHDDCSSSTSRSTGTTRHLHPQPLGQLVHPNTVCLLTPSVLAVSPDVRVMDDSLPYPAS